MIIACDVDGVVADLMTPWLRWYNWEIDGNKSADVLLMEQITQWDMHKIVHPSVGEKIYDFLQLPDAYDRVEPIDGALEGVNRLREMGHRVVFVTSTNVYQNGAKLKWLERHGFLELKNGFLSPDYVEMKDKSLIRADVMIDDYPKNLEGFFGSQLLFTQPWNQDESRFNRRDDWKGVVGFFEYWFGNSKGYIAYENAVVGKKE
jgi:5'-nucleotidase